MCQPSPGPRCAADTRAQQERARAAYAHAVPDGPGVDALTAADTVAAAELDRQYTAEQVGDILADSLVIGYGYDSKIGAQLLDHAGVRAPETVKGADNTERLATLIDDSLDYDWTPDTAGRYLADAGVTFAPAPIGV